MQTMLVDDSSPRTAVIIEDDPDVRDLLAAVLESAGFSTISAENGLDGVDAVLTHQPLITTLDVSMPGIDGFEAARRIRAESDTYIIMLTALDEEADVVLGLSAGADEYLNKPFRPRELRARIDALLRRPRNPGAAASDVRIEPESTPARKEVVEQDAAASDWVSHRDLRLSTDSHIALLGDRELELTRSEFDLLCALMHSQRRVRSKAELSLELRGDSYVTNDFVSEADKRTVEAHMTNLRRKLGDSAANPNYIETIRGVGYRLTADD
jgi:DNA-binding response OmpR family regulator